MKLFNYTKIDAICMGDGTLLVGKTLIVSSGMANPRCLRLIPAIFFIFLQDFDPAHQTQSVMAADGSAAFRAGPLGFLAGKEGFDPVFLDKIEVFDHAHMVF